MKNTLTIEQIIFLKHKLIPYYENKLNDNDDILDSIFRDRIQLIHNILDKRWYNEEEQSQLNTFRLIFISKQF